MFPGGRRMAQSAIQRDNLGKFNSLFPIHQEVDNPSFYLTHSERQSWAFDLTRNIICC